MRLLERDCQLEQLRTLLAKAGGGRGHLVALLGEAGVGKTALVETFAETVAEEARILRGACEDLSIPDVLAPLHDLAREAGWDLPQALSRGRWRLPLFSEALRVFGLQERSTLLVIEDLHWADEATLDFVRFLGRRIRNTRILLLVTARSDQSVGQAHVRHVLAEVPPDNVARIEVPLLSDAAVAELAREQGEDAAALYGLTAGNAFFVTELLRAGSLGNTPASLRDAVMARAGQLSPEARDLLDVVSVFPRRVEAAVLEQLCDEKVVETLSLCIGQGMLVAAGDGYAFRHEIARRAVEEELPAARRRKLNALALAVLKRGGRAASARLAHHAIKAEDSGAVREFAPRAAAEASRLGAHREAAGHYLAALAHANTFDIAERVRLYEGCAFECHLIGRMEEALRAMGAALELHRASGNNRKQGDALRWLSRLSYLAGDRAAADDFGRQAAELLAPLPPGPELAMAYSNLAQLAMLAGEREAALTHGDNAIALAEEFGRADILCHALNNQGTAEQWRSPRRARQLLDRSLTIALEQDFQEHAARSYTNRGCVEVNTFGYSEADRFLSEGIAYCEARDLDTWRDYMRGWRAELLLQQGRWNEAAEEALRVLGNDSATPLVRYPAAVALARLRLRRGDPTAGELLEELSAFLDKGMELQRLAPYACLMAERAWLGEGDRVAALGLIEKAEAIATDRAAAASVLSWRPRLAPESGMPTVDGAPEPFRLLFAGDWQGSAAAWFALGAPYEEALALLGGDAAAQQRALAIFEALGAGATVERVRGLLRERGLRPVARGPRAATQANPAGLTRRQMDVLRLLDQGCSNAQIAENLFVSPKTVDHHVSAILEKLEATSRGEAAAIARRLGLL